MGKKSRLKKMGKTLRSLMNQDAKDFKRRGEGFQEAYGKLVREFKVHLQPIVKFTEEGGLRPNHIVVDATDFVNEIEAAEAKRIKQKIQLDKAIKKESDKTIKEEKNGN